MSDRNGSQLTPQELQSLLEQRRADVLSCQLRDWELSLPCLRGLILGEGYGNYKLPPGTLVIGLRDLQVYVGIRIPQAGIEHFVEANSVPGALETLEQDLATDTVAWKYTYQEKQKQQRRAGWL